MKTIESDSADHAWISATRLFQDSRNLITYESRCGKCHDIGRMALLLNDPRQRWVLSRQPAINPAFALAECVWILTGRNDLAFLQYFNSEYAKYVGHSTQVYGAYGHRIRRGLGIDQLERAYNALKARPSSRQVVIQIWDSRLDLPKNDGSPSSEDIPCNLVSLLKVHGGSLEWTQILRSNDVFLGFPYNVIQFTTLLEIMCGWLGIGMGHYCHITDSFHSYEKDLKSIQAVSQIEIPSNIDSLMFSKEDSDRYFRELALRIEILIQPNLSKGEFLSITSWPAAPQAIRNVLYVLAAESARKRKWKSEREIIGNCTNGVLQIAFRNWCSSRSKNVST
ncbi:MAG: thymidylate synthase [Candidatus Zixiibacteriota bacterium]